MQHLKRSAFLFVAIGLVLYAGLSFGCERLLFRNGHSNALYKIATAPAAAEYDWLVLGASHAMPFDFDDFNAFMQRETGLRIVNLASPGTGPLYNRFVLQSFLRAHRAGNLLYVVDSFGFWSRAWNEDRFADAKLIRGTPFAPATAALLSDYVRDDGVSPKALLDYVSGFSKVNNRDRFQRDAWDGEAQFDRVYRPSASAVNKRIAYLYPDPQAPAVLARYIDVFTGLIAIARQHDMRVTAVKLPAPAQFRNQLRGEAAFNEGLTRLLAERAVPLCDFSTEIDDPALYFDTDHLNRKGLTELFQRRLKAVLATSGCGVRPEAAIRSPSSHAAL